MKYLIINTAFQNADYICVSDDNISAFKADSTAKHSETYLEYIDKALNDLNLTINDLDFVAVNIGPGSFTGVRIGVALAESFVCAYKTIKLIAFNSFEPLVNRLSDDGKIYIETGKKDYYIADIVNGKISDIYFGDMQDSDNNYILFEDKQESLYKVDELIFVALNKFNSGETILPSAVEPLYVKLSQAEQDLLKNE